MKLLTQVDGLRTEVEVTAAAIGAATSAQGAKADSALQPGSPLDASNLTGTVPLGSLPAAVATEAEVTSAIAAHAAASDPHPVYMTQPEGDARYRPLGQIPASDLTGVVSLGNLPGTLATESEVTTAIAAITPASIGAATEASLAGYQPLDSDLTAIAALTTSGLVERTGAGTATTRSLGATGASLLGAADTAAAQLALGLNAPQNQFYRDNYNTGTISLKTGGTKTDERWIYIPVYLDNYTRIVISRGFSDDSFGYGALSAVIECSVGVWGSSGGGSAVRIQKVNEYAWPGAFTGATNHLLREVRLLESYGSEVNYSGLWLRVMGDRTYKIAGYWPNWNIPPQEFSSYVPTLAYARLDVLTPAGFGVWQRSAANYYAGFNGYELLKPIVTSPNGTRYYLNVDNSGNLSTTPV